LNVYASKLAKSNSNESEVIQWGVDWENSTSARFTKSDLRD